MPRKRLVAAHPGEGVVQSSLDASLQRDLEALARRHAVGLERDAQIAILAVRSDDAPVRARVGGAGRERAGGYIDMTRAIRSPGSALKPFLYAIAFDEGIAAPETWCAMRRGGSAAICRRTSIAASTATSRWKMRCGIRSICRPWRHWSASAPDRFHAALRRAGADVRLPRRAIAEPGLALALGGVGMTLEDLGAALCGAGR